MLSSAASVDETLIEMQEKTAGEFLSFLRDLGVSVLRWMGDRLACNAPKGVLTPELKTELSSRKIELIEFLTHANLRGTPHARLIRKLDNRPELPLSCGQQRFWFLDLFESGEQGLQHFICFRSQG